MARGVGRTRRRGSLGRGMAVLAVLAGLAVPSVALVGSTGTPALSDPSSAPLSAASLLEDQPSDAPAGAGPGDGRQAASVSSPSRTVAAGTASPSSAVSSPSPSPSSSSSSTTSDPSLSPSGAREPASSSTAPLASTTGPEAPAPTPTQLSRRGATGVPAPVRQRWVGTWSTAVSQPVAGQALAGFRNTTIRQRVHVSLGGAWVRVRLTNVFGSGPVKIGPVTVARTGAKAGATRAGTLRAVTFGGQPTVTLARGAEIVSDAVRLDVPSDSDLLLSLYLPGPTGPATYHAAARATGWTASGNHTADATSDGFAGRTASYWFLDGVDVQSHAGGSVAFVGDSITDGGGSTQDADRRWPDYLADRMLTRATTLQFGVLNAGISGNRVLLDAVNPGQGPSVLHRLDRDALDQQAVRTVVLAAGVNDIQQAPVEPDPAKIIAGYEQVAARARAAGLRVVGATITPFEGWSQWTPQREAVRREVNAWVRTAGVFDDYLDFDAVLRDPSRPQRLRAEFDCGDHLHPRDAGYAAMAASVDLATLLP